MCPYSYYNIMRNCKDKSHQRLQMVNHALQHGIKPTARFFSTTPATVRLWLKRFQASGLNGLKELSRRPKHSPRTTPDHVKQHLKQLKKRYKRIGADQIKFLEDLSVSPRTMRKIWRELGISSRKRRKKHLTKRNLREVKKQFAFLQHTCEDTKELNDIPEYYAYMLKHNLPTTQYTFRDMSTGLQLTAYGSEKSLTYATLFADYIQSHFLSHQIDLSGNIRQTDNGSEYIGSWNAKHDSAFTKTIQSIAGQIHQTIPVRAHRYQADVETVHDIIEREFFEIESFSSRQDFFNKIYSYQLFFNLKRPNTYKEGKTPWQLIQEKSPDLDISVAMLPPLDLDAWLAYKSALQNSTQGVYDVSSSPLIALI
jgi:transposase